MVFVTRKFPPSLGGMETLSAGVWRSLQAGSGGNHLIAHGGPNRALVWWFPGALVRLGRRLWRDRGAAVLTGDALTWAVIEPVARLFRRPAATLVMGLDMSYPGKLYGALVRPALRRAPHVIAISQASAEQARAVGVESGRISVLRLGVPVPPEPDRSGSRSLIEARLDLGSDAFIALTLGRLVRRKGVRWFVETVLPRTPSTVHYVVAGRGPESEAVAEASAAAGVAERVHLLGGVDDETREGLLAGADLFVQPNIPVPGDMEGFGLVVVEAALRGTPVLASALEGIRDAVVDGETGVLVPPADGPAWVEAVARLVADRASTAEMGRRFAAKAAEIYSEERMGRELREILGL